MNIININKIDGKQIEIVNLSLSNIENILVLSLNIYCDNANYIMNFYNVSLFRINDISLPMIIQGFEIIDNKKKGWDSVSRYKINDFEENLLSFYCEYYDFN